MKIEVSNGELIDKITILEIKLDKISQEEKRKHILKEINTIKKRAAFLIEKVEDYYAQLKTVNLELWNIEDRIRAFEKAGKFDEEFIRTARSVYYLNDKRAQLKLKINQLTGSDLIEQKSYESY